MKRIFGVSCRSKGIIVDGRVTASELISKDVITPLPIDFSDIHKLQSKILKELKRQELVKNRKDKINNINKNL